MKKTVSEKTEKIINELKFSHVQHFNVEYFETLKTLFTVKGTWIDGIFKYNVHVFQFVFYFKVLFCVFFAGEKKKTAPITIVSIVTQVKSTESHVTKLINKTLVQ